jgi:hypothetical protein
MREWINLILITVIISLGFLFTYWIQDHISYQIGSFVGVALMTAGFVYIVNRFTK